MIENLNKMFSERYKQLSQDVNKFVQLTPMIEKDGITCYNVPSVKITGDGSTVVPLGPGTVQLNKPALVDVTVAPTQGVMAFLRVNIPMSECEMAANNQQYFNYLFDEVMDKSLKMYAQKYGSYEDLRFGEFYAKFEPLMIYQNTEPNGIDAVELRIVGKYAKK